MPGRSSAPGWHARLDLHFRLDDARTLAHDSHSGPLRVLRRLYPEGPSVCHTVLVHPPGGIVGGDRLDIDVRLGAGAHALITTPGATRFYRSSGAGACQSARAHLADGARLEWLPLEAIAYDDCDGANKLVVELEPGAQMIGWDVLALGLPASGRPFATGRFVQHLEIPGAWLERAIVSGTDTRLLQSPLGLDGHSVLAVLWFATGAPLADSSREALLAAARQGASDMRYAGATAPDERVVVLRALAHRVEPAMELLKRVWTAWRTIVWRLDACPPRVWKT